MSTLSEFIAARLDEDEATAKAAIESHPRGKGEWRASGDAYGAAVCGADDGVIVYNEGAPSLQEAEHIARHDPVHALRDTAVTRAVLALHGPAQSEPGDCSTCYVPEPGWAANVPAERPCATLRSLASGWSDHPDYRKEWRLQ